MFLHFKEALMQESGYQLKDWMLSFERIVKVVASDILIEGKQCSVIFYEVPIRDCISGNISVSVRPRIVLGSIEEISLSLNRVKYGVFYVLAQIKNVHIKQEQYKTEQVLLRKDRIVEIIPANKDSTWSHVVDEVAEYSTVVKHSVKECYDLLVMSNSLL